MLYKNLNPDGTLIIESYMYSPSLGREFLPLYFDFRINVIKKLLMFRYNQEEQIGHEFVSTIRFLNSHLTLLSSRNFLSEVLNGNSSYIEGILNDSLSQSTFPETGENESKYPDRIFTEDLISNLIYLKTNHLKNDQKLFTDLLIQKFEVSKKLSDYYHIVNNHGNITISKGSDDSASVRTHWMFSLLLLTNSVGLDGTRILSSLLKINDFLCTISIDRIAKVISARQLAISLAIEALIVNDIKERILAADEIN